MEPEWKLVGTVKKLCIFPLKSGRRLELIHSYCTKQGLMEVANESGSLSLRDRCFVVYHDKYFEYRTARHYPKMVLIQIQSYGSNYIQISAPGMETLIIPVPPSTGTEVCILQIKENFRLLDCGDEVAAWISRYVLNEHSGLRLGYNSGIYQRQEAVTLYKNLIEHNYRGLTSESLGLSADLCAILLITATSVQDVVNKTGISEITVDNFRPNIVVDDPKFQPFEEDNWEFLKIGNAIFRNVLECARCVMTTINMETGIRRMDREPLRTLKQYRLGKGPSSTSPILGIYLEVIQTGHISLNDDVYIGKQNILLEL